MAKARTIVGPGVGVTIDEISIFKRKYNAGRLPGQWMFGGIERDTALGFVRLVEQRDANTLLSIIQEFVLPGSVIYSDLWAAYGGIDALPNRCHHFQVIILQ